MLIVNADDLGLRMEVSEAILECWERGGITSATAMVEMEDSARAFGLAADVGLPLGLHLNLTTPFTAAGAPADRAARQRRAVEYFAGPGRRFLLLDPRMRGLLDVCVADQLTAFAEASGAAAVHADGHQHVQVCPTVLSTRSLARLTSLRRAQSFLGGRHSPVKRAYRAGLNLAVRRRFRSVRFVSLRDLHPALGGTGLDPLWSICRREDVEVMTHPAWEDEREVLLSRSWRQMLAGLPTGSHAAQDSTPP